MQKETNIAQRRIPSCQSSSMNQVFENWHTSESLTEDGYLNWKLKDEKEPVMQSSKKKSITYLLQRVNFHKDWS